MMNFIKFEYLVACAMYTYGTQCITMRDLNEYRMKLEAEFKKRNIEAMFLFSSKYAYECVHDNPDVFELICDGTAVRRKDEVSIENLISKYMSYMSNDDLLAVTAVKNALDERVVERVVVTLDNGKVNRNGRVYSDELLAKYNASCPREIRCGDKVVGHMEHVSHYGEQYVAAMTIDKDMTEEVKNLAMGIRAVGEIDEDGECHELSIESIDFVKGE